MEFMLCFIYFVSYAILSVVLSEIPSLRTSERDSFTTVCLEMNICEAGLLCFPFINLEMFIFTAKMILYLLCNACSFDNENFKFCFYEIITVIFIFVIMEVIYKKYDLCLLLLLLQNTIAWIFQSG